MANKLLEMFDGFTENLNKTFYSKDERRIEVGRNTFSTTTPVEMIHEPDVIPGDLSYSYSWGSHVDYIITQRNNLIKTWRHATYIPEVDEALQEILNEALVFEEDDTLPFDLQLHDLDVTDPVKGKIQKSFEKIINMLDFQLNGQNLFKQWYVDGVLSFEVVYDNSKLSQGIKKIILLSPYNFYKYKDITTGEYFYFLNTRLPDDSQSFTLTTMAQAAEIKYKPEQITQITSGILSEDRLFSISPINKALKVINQLQLIEDSLVIHRITRAPEKKVFYIDTGRLPKAKAEQYIQNLMMKHRNKMVYNYDTGSVENRKRAISVLEDYWLPRSADGKGTQIETLSGSDADLSNIADLEHFYGKVYKALNVPVQRREMESSFSAVTVNNLDVERDEIKFFKSIVQLRKRFTPVIKDLLKKDLISSKVFTLKDWNRLEPSLRLAYKNANNYAEAKKLMLFQQRMEIAEMALGLVESNVVTRKWIQREIMGYEEEDWKLHDVEEEEEVEKYGEPEPAEGGEGGEAGGAAPAPGSAGPPESLATQVPGAPA